MNLMLQTVVLYHMQILQNKPIMLASFTAKMGCVLQQLIDNQILRAINCKMTAKPLHYKE